MSKKFIENEYTLTILLYRLCVCVYYIQNFLFLHKYDPKRHLIFSQVLEVDKQNPFKLI